MCTKNGSYCEKEKKSGGGQGKCERRSEAFVKIQKKKNCGGGMGDQGGKKNFRGGGGGGGGRLGVRVDVNGEVKLL